MREAGVQQQLTDLTSLWRIRHFEEVQDLCLSGQIAGSAHLCSGQEAIYVGACTALDLRRDVIFPTYRGHGWAMCPGALIEGSGAVVSLSSVAGLVGTEGLAWRTSRCTGP